MQPGVCFLEELKVLGGFGRKFLVPLFLLPEEIIPSSPLWYEILGYPLNSEFISSLGSSI